MRYLFLLVFPLFACVTEKSYTLPKTWTNDLSITLYTGGGDDYFSLHVTYTADSCNYDSMQNGVHTLNKFKLSDADKSTILTKLREFNLSKVRTKSVEQRHDHGTEELCIVQGAKAKCWSSSSSEEISGNVEGFNKACAYLEKFARDHH